MAPLNEKEQTDLVAYLDGELDEEAARELEAKLHTDPQARAEAEAFKKTWELLDYLPRPEPSTGFTHRTMERLSAQLPTSGLVARPGRGRRLAAVLGWAAAVLLASGAGFAGVTYLVSPKAPPGRPPADPLAGRSPREVEHDLVVNLRVLENKRLYEHVDDVEFLKGLDDPDLFGEER